MGIADKLAFGLGAKLEGGSFDTQKDDKKNPKKESKILVPKVEKLNLNLMLAQIIDDFYPTLSELNKKIELNNEQQIMLVADPDKLGRVFNNLIKNAINYSAENSNIRINVRKNEYNIILQ